jgi:uncharacterized protein YuzE
MLDRAIFKKQVRRTLLRPDRCYAQEQDQIAEYVTSGGVVIRAVYRFIKAPRESLHIVTVVRLGKLRGASQGAAIATVSDPLVDAAYIGLLNGRIAQTAEVGPGVYFDLGDDGEVVGAEILNYSRYGTGENDSSSLFERLPFFSS